MDGESEEVNFGCALADEFLGACDSGSAGCDDIVKEEDALVWQGFRGEERVFEIFVALFGVEANLGFGVTGSAKEMGLNAGFGKREGQEF